MNYRRDVTSVIQIGEEETRVEGYYHLDKTVVCDSDEIARGIVEKLDRLQKEDFNKIHIPKFDYYAMDNAIRYRVEFIKGAPLGTVSKFKGDIYDDIVERESDWTFDDYGYGNFVVEWKTLKIYAVDFTSYRYMPDREERRRKWKQYTEKNKWELGMVLNNGSITH